MEIETEIRFNENGRVAVHVKQEDGAECLVSEHDGELCYGWAYSSSSLVKRPPVSEAVWRALFRQCAKELRLTREKLSSTQDTKPMAERTRALFRELGMPGGLGGNAVVEELKRRQDHIVALLQRRDQPLDELIVLKWDSAVPDPRGKPG